MSIKVYAKPYEDAAIYLDMLEDREQELEGISEQLSNAFQESLHTLSQLAQMRGGVEFNLGRIDLACTTLERIIKGEAVESVLRDLMEVEDKSPA